jgi:glycosyltransferase involved in cell wall biosynthesis
MTVKRILHLYSNFKWTGPADHALNLASWLKAFKKMKIYFACARRPGVQNRLYQKAVERELTCVDGMYLNKHFSWKIFSDIFSLKKIVLHDRIDLIHSHQDNDALTAVLSGFGDRLIRTCYDGEPTPLNSRQRFTFGRTAMIFTASLVVQAHLSKILAERPVEHVDIPVDGGRFCPRPKNEKLLTEFGIGIHEPVAGIVARVQKHRKFDMLLDAIEQVTREIPRFKFLIVGRGTHINSLARRPVKQRGLEKNVIFTGYREDDYGEVLNLFDYKVFLTPGSDGSCRAVREAFASGKPVIASRTGILPELIEDGKTGLLLEGGTADLARAMLTMAKEPKFRQQCSRNARQYALNVLNPARYVKKMVACYDSLRDKNSQVA